jgi:hypothetical protein
MATKGPDDRERFALREEAAGPRSGVISDPERNRSVKVVAGGSILEALCGAGAVVLAILGLAGLMPGYLTAIAVIVFGVALVAQGGAVASRVQQLVRETAPTEWDTRAELGGGMGAELLGGAAGVVLGILALIGVGGPVLLPIAVIVFGGALLLGSATSADLGHMGGTSLAHERFAHATRQASAAAAGTQALAGIGAIVLGILALVGLDPMVLSLVALLVLGAAVILSGSAITSRMSTLMRR